MQKHEEKQCPRCSNLFECRAGDMYNCQCYAVALSDAAKLFLESTSYDDCLCKNCLLQIEQMVQFGLRHEFPKQGELMIEGLHYYFDNGYFVFTELYHLQRGYCCNNNCRHCAYGNRQQ
ncbi:MAG TPA: cysteine-rich CWC family protein [Parafilimonas sp.]|nr:cysteine-rich CWC family protein [Parafilimonas sp.]